METLHDVQKNNRTYNAGFLVTQILDFTEDGKITLASNMNERQSYTVEVPASTSEIVKVIAGDYFPEWFEDLLIFYFDTAENVIFKNGKWYDSGKKLSEPKAFGLITFIP